MATQTLTPSSLQLFLHFAHDAGNWNGQPLVDVTKEQRGNLSQLKRAGLVETFVDDGCTWLNFTDAGVTLACDYQIDLTRWR